LAVNTTGTTTFGGVVGGATALTSLTTDAGGITAINGGAITTTGGQTYNDSITLGANTTLNAVVGNITFGNTLNGAFSLTANSTGTTTFGDVVGGATALTSLTTDAGGTTAINGGTITTSGNQVYGDDVTMNQATTLTSAGGAITFGGNATNSAPGGGITVDAPTINLTGGTTIETTGNGPISFFTDTLNPNGARINAGTGAFSLAPNVLTRTIEFGDVNTGRVTDVYYGSNFGSVTAGSFTIGRPTHTGNIYVTGVATAPSALTLINGGAGSVTFENASYLSGNQNLGVVSGSGGIDLGTNLTIGTGTLRMTTAGAITQTAGTLSAGTLGLSAGTGITLTQPTNNVTTFAAQTGAGDLTLTETDGFTIGSVGATADTFHPAITGLNASAGTITLQSGGAVTQTAVITASGLRLLGGGAYILTNGSNDVTTLAANTTGAIQYTNANALSVGTVGATTGITSGNSNITLTTNTGNLTLNEVVNAGTGSVSLTTLTGSILDGNGGANNLNASTANLSAANSIGTTGDPLDTTVNVLNATTTAGGIFVSETDAVTLGTVIATGGNIAISNNTGDMTITLVSAPAGTVDLSALGGSILSGGGAGPHLTAGSNSTLQAFNGVVGTQTAPVTVNVNPGTLSVRATTAVAGISAFLTGTVLPGNALTLLNAPPGLVCFNGCPVASSPVSGLATGLVRSTFGYLNPETIIPAFYPQSSGSVLISDITSLYMPGSLLLPSPVSLSPGSPAVQSMGPKDY
jgi:hypothetical protein